jgi:phosphoribosylanthranilate isomerase
MIRANTSPRVKICGITNLDDARCAVLAGADFLGFIFYPKSPRYVTVEQVEPIVQAIRGEFGPQSPRFVGVFVNEPAETVRTILASAGLDLAQLHGHETPGEVQALLPWAFKAIRPQTRREAEAAITDHRATFSPDEALPQMLVDAYQPGHYGGTGLQADLDLARAAARRCRLLLAGGLAPENVGAAIRQVQPWGVDVSSGVERARGLKDHDRLRTFVQAAKGGGSGS